MELQPWFDATEYQKLAYYLQLPQTQRELVDAFRTNGFVIIPDTGIDEATIDSAVRTLRNKYTESATGYGERGRVHDAWRFNQYVRAIALSERVLSTLRTLYAREPIPFQTLNFKKPTEQRPHSDTVHFNSLPHGFMCGVWVALEDVDATNGPLFYYPGSQRLPVYHMHDLGLEPGYDSYKAYEDKIESILESSPYRRQEAHLKKGQALIWSHNIFHGGCRVIDRSRSRLSQVTHFYFPGCIYYTPLLSEPLEQRWMLRTVVDIRNGQRGPRYEGIGSGLSRLANTYRGVRALVKRFR